MAATKNSGGGGSVVPVTPTKTGGDGPDPSQDQGVIRMDEDEPQIKVRKEFVTGEDFSFNPVSLIGSWFHRLENDEILWQGVIVGEPGPGHYLCEISRMAPGAENVQVIINVKDMLLADEGYEWRFFDSEDKATVAFQDWTLRSRERA